ncbi:BRO family, N-terminal domain [Marinospirillum celere]|uniref:BRO family, N-terminal domain n=1 Tax=Marinospirillum celere TaxID=1122252 RepID=A0A1I1E2A3_9GAMM|nr:BRO family protein [Marinospirillum celere]SFB80796.1 BRO family, N-terminal domain [Marinospirillum celere]
MNQLGINNNMLEAISLEENAWVRAVQLGEALGYTKPGKQINALYKRYQDEFTEDMTKLTKIHDDECKGHSASQNRQTRVFSRQGVYLMIMLARTPEAKLMREKMLDDLHSVVTRVPTTAKDLPAWAQEEIVEVPVK